jgi:hypothetical protein
MLMHITNLHLNKPIFSHLTKNVGTSLDHMQVPGTIIVRDQTEALRSEGYWTSYNRAAYPEIQKLTGTNGMIEEFGDWFTHNKTPRAKIFKRDQDKVSSSKTDKTCQSFSHNLRELMPNFSFAIISYFPDRHLNLIEDDFK